MESNLVYGLTIKERVNKMKEIGLGNTTKKNEEQFIEWRSRPTLVDDQLFLEILKKYELSSEEYGLGTRELSDNEKIKLEKEVKNEEWIVSFNNIMNIELDSSKITPTDFSYPIRKYLVFIKLKIQEILKENKISFSDKALEKYMDSVMDDLLDISLKTFVYDLQVYKDEKKLVGLNEKERFNNYLKTRFEKKEDLRIFFCDYPALTRLLSVKVKFIIDNFRELLNTLSESEKELSEQFSLISPIVVTDITLGAGDTHDKGKTVSIIQVNDSTELVCKPKNLDVSTRFDAFIHEIQNLEPDFDFYSINRIVKEHYTIEEKLPHKECSNEEEIKHFYRQFGHTISLIYLLNGNDFHFENIIAYGKYPLLIDLETIVQNYFPPKTDHAFEKFFIDVNQSVLITGLLPVFLFDDRKDEDIDSAERGLQLSALSGDEQKIPFKMLQLINFDTDEMQYEYQELTMDGSENIPMMDGKKVDFTSYVNLICDGFNEFSTFFIEHKSILIEKAKEIFSDCLVRHVIKTTQSYSDMLNYSIHPVCMLAMCEREKVLENLWVNYYTNDDPVYFEVRDLLVGDIPIFYNNTSSTSLLEGEGSSIPNIYRQTGIELMIDRMKNFDLNELKRQEDFMHIALGLYDPFSLSQIQIEVSEITKNQSLSNYISDFIGNMIVEAAIEGENSVTWPYIKEMGIDDFSVEMINENFYNGLTGIYLFLSQLYFRTKNENVKRVYQKAETLVIELAEEFIDGASCSAFFGSLSAIYPLLLTYGETKEKKYLDYIEMIAEDFMDDYDGSRDLSIEWLNGTASAVVIFCHLYRLTKESDYLNFAKNLLESYDVTSLKVAGFGHGYSGIISACIVFLDLQEDKEIEVLLSQCLKYENELFDEEKQGWINFRNNRESVEDMWCYGSVGVGFGRLALLEAGCTDDRIKDDFHIVLNRILSNQKLDSCICHGIMGDISFLADAYNSSFVSEEEKMKIKKYLKKVQADFMSDGKLSIEGLQSFPSYGLFTGLAGVGYELLRIESSGNIPNVLTFEYPESLVDQHV